MHVSPDRILAAVNRGYSSATPSLRLWQALKFVAADAPNTAPSAAYRSELYLCVTTGLGRSGCEDSAPGRTGKASCAGGNLLRVRVMSAVGALLAAGLVVRQGYGCDLVSINFLV